VFSGETPGVRDLTRLVISKSDKWCIFNYDILARKAETAVEMKDANGNTVRNNVVERYLWVDLINNSLFDRVAVDEAHYIKNTDSQRSKAVRMLTCKSITFMTGTPVLNRPGELWPMLTMIRPDQFPEEQTFLNRYTFNGKEAKNVDELRALLKGIMIRRLKKDVIKDLPALERIYDWHEMGEREWEVYNKVLQGVYIALDAWNPGEAGAEQAVPNILAQIMRLKQVCAISKLDRVSDLATELYDTHENGGASKVIIFSQFKPVARGIARRLGNEAVWMTGDLNEHERQAVVDRFQNDPSVHFLCGTWQVMGEGRNLTAAGYVIFSDLFWTPANHQQCEERCYGRIGDMHGATSYYVVCKDTVEDWIQEILARKLRVINEVVEGIDSERSASMANELLTRMKQEMRRHR
jgi:SNF2 family DNA or RNA helicase